MADNERVQWTFGDVGFEQQAPSQANRTMFTPGKASSKPLDQNWPEDFRIPTGTPSFDERNNGPVKMQRTRVVKLGRNTVSDQVLDSIGPIPIVLPSGETTTLENDGNLERRAGHDENTGH